MSQPPQTRPAGVIGCHACGWVSTFRPAGRDPARCPRCHARLYRRYPQSIAQSWALLIAAVIFYIPANVLPVMYTQLPGNSGESTIIGGVIDFWQSGSYGVALIIFIASAMVPCTKFLVLGMLLITARKSSSWARVGRTRLFRLIDLIGYWSMLDVMVVAIVAALVKFNGIGVVEPRIGILFFGLMVIFTMLATMRFDPRLIWDGADQ